MMGSHRARWSLTRTTTPSAISPIDESFFSFLARPDDPAFALNSSPSSSPRQTDPPIATDQPIASVGPKNFELIDEQARSLPYGIAMMSAESGWTVTYRDLQAQSNGTAHFLRGKNFGRKAIVALRMKRDAHIVQWILGVLNPGLAYVCVTRITRQIDNPHLGRFWRRRP
ncbi:hypothetical protein BDZ88DRAFT_25713 [Geranomyces variabilis]|nr:hypothetical protein BDZ88DRAFT_25713 [Geranomyces variabilis]